MQTSMGMSHPRPSHVASHPLHLASYFDAFLSHVAGHPGCSARGCAGSLAALVASGRAATTMTKMTFAMPWWRTRRRQHDAATQSRYNTKTWSLKMILLPGQGRKLLYPTLPSFSLLFSCHSSTLLAHGCCAVVSYMGSLPFFPPLPCSVLSLLCSSLISSVYSSLSPFPPLLLSTFFCVSTPTLRLSALITSCLKPL